MTDTPISAERIAEWVRRRDNDPNFVTTVSLANAVLDRVNADPDDDLATLARRFLREKELTDALIAHSESRSRLSALPESGGAATKPIASDDEHAVALARVEELMDARAGTPDGDELSALVDRVEAYEDKRWPIAAPSPDALAQERAGANGIAAELYALYDALAAWPKLPDGLVLRHIGSNAAGHPDDWERGKVIQRELPTGSIPFSYESEAGAGFWDRITNGEWRDDDAALRTRAKEKTDE